MTRIYKLEADGVVYWVSASNLEDAVELVREDERAGDEDFTPELGTAMSRADIERVEVTMDGGDARLMTLLELFDQDASRRVIACSEWA